MMAHACNTSTQEVEARVEFEASLCWIEYPVSLKKKKEEREGEREREEGRGSKGQREEGRKERKKKRKKVEMTTYVTRR